MRPHTPGSQRMCSPCLMQTSLHSDLGTAMTFAGSSANPTFLIVHNAASGLSLPRIPSPTDFVCCLCQTPFVWF